MALRDFLPFSSPKRHSEPNDQQLIGMIQEGGPARDRAIAFLHERHFDLIPIMEKKYGRLDEEAILTAYNDAILALDKSVFTGQFEGRASLRTFFSNILTRKCIDQLRQLPTNIIREMDAGSPPQNPGSDQEPEAAQPLSGGKPWQAIIDLSRLTDNSRNPEELMGEEEFQRLYAAILRDLLDLVNVIFGKINPNCSKLLEDRSNGLSLDMLADRYGYNKNALKSTISQCTKRVRELLCADLEQILGKNVCGAVSEIRSPFLGIITALLERGDTIETE